MSSAAGIKSSGPTKGFLFLPPPPQLPSAVGLHGSEVTTARLDGGGRERTMLVCGFEAHPQRADGQPEGRLAERLSGVREVVVAGMEIEPGGGQRALGIKRGPSLAQRWHHSVASRAG